MEYMLNMLMYFFILVFLITGYFFLYIRIIDKKKFFQIISVIAFGVFLAAILYLTVFERSYRPAQRANFVPFSSYWGIIKRYTVFDYFEQIMINIAIFIPFGLLLPNVLKKEKLSWKTYILLPLIFSILIEITQLIFHLGTCEIDDVINNTFGAYIGYSLNISLHSITKEKGKYHIDKKEFLKGMLPLILTIAFFVLLSALREVLYRCGVIV